MGDDQKMRDLTSCPILSLDGVMNSGLSYSSEHRAVNTAGPYGGVEVGYSPRRCPHRMTATDVPTNDEQAIEVPGRQHIIAYVTGGRIQGKHGTFKSLFVYPKDHKYRCKLQD